MKSVDPFDICDDEIKGEKYSGLNMSKTDAFIWSPSLTLW